MDNNNHKSFCFDKRLILVGLLAFILVNLFLLLNNVNKKRLAYKSEASSCNTGDRIVGRSGECWHKTWSRDGYFNYCRAILCSSLTPTQTITRSTCPNGERVSGSDDLCYFTAIDGRCSVRPCSRWPVKSCLTGCSENIDIGDCVLNQYGQNTGKRCVCRERIALYEDDFNYCLPDNRCAKSAVLCPDGKTLINKCQKNADGMNTGYFCNCPTTAAVNRPNRLELIVKYDVCPIGGCGFPDQKCSDGSPIGACSKNSDGKYSGYYCSCARGYDYPTLEKADVLGASCPPGYLSPTETPFVDYSVLITPSSIPSSVNTVLP